MNDSINNIFKQDFMPHGHCYQWAPEILWLNVVSDVLIAFAYFTIPLAIYYFVKKRPDLEFKGVFILFSLFILFCGITHIISIYVIWHGAYGIHGLSKLATAVVSCMTAYVVYKSIPIALSMPNIEDVKNAFEKANTEKLARMALENQKAQDQLLRESTDHAHVGIIAVNERGMISVANKAVCHIFGYEKAELEGQGINLLIPNKMQHKHPSLVEAFIYAPKQERRMAAERMVIGRGKNGQDIPLEIVLSHRLDGDTPLVYASILDISERILAQEALKASELNTKNIINALPIGLHVFVVQGDDLVLKQYNPAADRILHLDNSALLDLPIEEAFPDLVGTDIKARYMHVAKTGQPLIDYKAHYDDGSISGVFLVHCFQSATDQVSVMFQNITEKHKVEQKIAQKDAFIRRAFDASVTGVAIYQLADLNVSFINASFTTMTGYTLDDLHLVPKGMLGLTHLDDSDQERLLLTHFGDSANDDSELSREFRLRDKQGAWIWCLAKDVVFERTEHGEVVSVMRTILDISQQKMMQQHLAQLKESAEQAAQAKSTFLANMSHEIRTPMNAILGLMRVVLTMELGDKQRDYLDKIEAASKSLLAILNDVLDLSKVEAGKIDIANEAFDVQELIQQLSATFQVAAQQKAIRLKFMSPLHGPAFYLGDRQRITQILNNMLANAIKFTAQGEVCLHLDIQSQPNSEREVLSFAISDTGIGIEEAALSQLFQSFQQADSSIHREYGGTGLGLSISKELANLMGGNIEVSSVLGKGSCFTFSLALQPSAMTFSAAKSNKPDEFADLSHLKVLVVEDNLTNQLVAAELLRLLHIEATICNNGKEALALLANEVFDIVLMDLQMPVMDGFTATRAIREQQKFADLPIIAMSAAVLSADVKKVTEAGMNDHVGKPVDVHQLQTVIQKWTSKPSAALSSESLAIDPQHTPTLSPSQAQKVLAPASQNQSKSSASSLQECVMALQEHGIDVQSALDMLQGNCTLYTTLVSSFVDEHSHTLPRLQAGGDNESKEWIARTAHTLKGLAGTLGLTQLQTCAKLTESTINSGDNMQVRELGNALEDALMVYRAFLSEPVHHSGKPDITPPAVNDAAALSHIEKLAEQLEKQQYMKADDIAKSKLITKALLPADIHEQVFSNIKRLEYAKAHVLLLQFLQDHPRG